VRLVDLGVIWLLVVLHRVVRRRGPGLEVVQVVVAWVRLVLLLVSFHHLAFLITVFLFTIFIL
jgi:hypothetical protein